MAADEFRIEHDTMGEVRVPAAARWGAQTQRAVENFPVSGLPDRAGADRRAGVDQGRGGGRQPRARGAAGGRRRRHPRRGRRGRRGRSGTTQFPVDVFQTGSGTSTNMNMNEVHRQPRRGAARAARAPERRGERVAVVQRRVPVGDPPRGRARDAPSTLLPALDHLAGALARAGRAPRRGGEGGPHPPDGRHPGHPRPGARRATPPRSTPAADRIARRPAAGGPAARSAAPRSARAERAGRVRRRRRAPARRRHAACRCRRPPTTSPPRARATSWSASPATCACWRPRCSRSPTTSAGWRRAEDRPRRDPPARPAAGHLDHAGQGEPGPPRGGQPGVRPGVRQRRRGGLRREPGQLRAQRLPAGDRPQPARVDPPARRRSPACSPTAASPGSRPTSSGAAPTPRPRRRRPPRSTRSSATSGSPSW